jgi:hypothetical protein
MARRRNALRVALGKELDEMVEPCLVLLRDGEANCDGCHLPVSYNCCKQIIKKLQLRLS